jgi:hypothetical protein
MGERRLSAKPDAVHHGAGADQFALEFGKPASTVNIKRPCVVVVPAHASLEATKARDLGGDRRQRVQEISGRAHQPVEARHHQHVALGKLIERAAQLDGRSSRRLLFH